VEKRVVLSVSERKKYVLAGTNFLLLLSRLQPTNFSCYETKPSVDAVLVICLVKKISEKILPLLT
jgi:hypothetical protein